MQCFGISLPNETPRDLGDWAVKTQRWNLGFCNFDLQSSLSLEARGCDLGMYIALRCSFYCLFRNDKRAGSRGFENLSVRKRGGVQKSMGNNKVTWKTRMLTYLPVTSRPLILPQKEAFLSPCNFATTHLTACILNVYLPLTSQPAKWRTLSQRPNQISVTPLFRGTKTFQNTCFIVSRRNQRGADGLWPISADFLNTWFPGLLSSSDSYCLRADSPEGHKHRVTSPENLGKSCGPPRSPAEPPERPRRTVWEANFRALWEANFPGEPRGGLCPSDGDPPEL